MPEDLHSKVVHHPLPQIGGQQGLTIVDQELQQQRTSKKQGKGAEQTGISRGNGNIQCSLREDGSYEGEPRSREQQQHGQHRETAIWSQVGEQASQQAGVVALLENFVLIHSLSRRLGQRRLVHSLETATHPT